MSSTTAEWLENWHYPALLFALGFGLIIVGAVAGSVSQWRDRKRIAAFMPPERGAMGVADLKEVRARKLRGDRGGPDAA